MRSLSNVDGRGCHALLTTSLKKSLNFRFWGVEQPWTEFDFRPSVWWMLAYEAGGIAAHVARILETKIEAAGERTNQVV